MAIMKRLCLVQERIAFPPHPKTLTMAGDYEYFAAQVILQTSMYPVNIF
jgi:hypothetical protein